MQSWVYLFTLCTHPLHPLSLLNTATRSYVGGRAWHAPESHQVRSAELGKGAIGAPRVRQRAAQLVGVGDQSEQRRHVRPVWRQRAADTSLCHVQAFVSGLERAQQGGLSVYTQALAWPHHCCGATRAWLGTLLRPEQKQHNVTELHELPCAHMCATHATGEGSLQMTDAKCRSQAPRFNLAAGLRRHALHEYGVAPAMHTHDTSSMAALYMRTRAAGSLTAAAPSAASGLCSLAAGSLRCCLHSGQAPPAC